MKIYKLTPFIFAIIAMFASADANEIDSFDQAMSVAKQKNIPLLLEFVRDDCLYCKLAETEADTVTAIKNALASVVHYSIDIHTDEGESLKDDYSIGVNFPVFILTNSNGEPILRWTGYTTPQRFISSLRKGLAIDKTIAEREMAFQSKPNVKEAVALGAYYSECGKHIKSNDYYSYLAKSGNLNYYYDIFRNRAVACEKGKIPYDSVLIAADNVIDSKQNIIKMVRILCNLARTVDKTETLGPYLDEGIMVAFVSSSYDESLYTSLFGAEKALYIELNIEKALELKKKSMKKNWQSKPDKYFEFAEWCLTRKINLPEAEKYARKAAKVASSGKFKGRVLIKLAMILKEQGKTPEAINYAKMALAEDENNEYYRKIIEKYQAEL